MNTQLSTEFVTHKLVIRIDGEMKFIYLTRQEALQIANGINGNNPFIAITNTKIDKNAPRFYPKQWCYLEPLSKVEIEKIQCKQKNKFNEYEKSEHEIKSEEDTKLVKEWIINHPGEWGNVLNKANDYFQNKPYKTQALVKSKARLLVLELCHSSSAINVKQ
jgi:hypothetical protein